MMDNAPIRTDEEWANAWTHGFAAAATVVLAIVMIWQAGRQSGGLAVACFAYAVSVFATFTFSTLSHVIFRQPTLNTLRAWDQAMIYAMISGTYTPIIYRYASDSVRTPLLAAIWVAALSGIAGKLLLRHRINNVATISYLLLGWLPAIPMFNKVPVALGVGTLIGGVLYTVGVAVLINDAKAKYLHALWHVLVMLAALCHYLAIRWYVIG
ncbi:MAG: hemolysin III family protein [Planctomycetota bacterium]